MKSNEIVYADHKASTFNLNANVASILMYASVVVLSLIPYVQYIAWLLPLIFVFKEKNSDFVRYSAAQSLTINLFVALADFILTLFATIFSVPSSCIIAAIMNITLSPFTSVLYMIVFIIGVIFNFIAIKYAVSYNEHHFKYFSAFCKNLIA